MFLWFFISPFHPLSLPSFLSLALLLTLTLTSNSLNAPQAHSTIGGYLCAQAGEIPSTGEMIVFSGYRFTVVSTPRTWWNHANGQSESPQSLHHILLSICPLFLFSFVWFHLPVIDYIMIQEWYNEIKVKFTSLSRIFHFHEFLISNPRDHYYHHYYYS